MPFKYKNTTLILWTLITLSSWLFIAPFFPLLILPLATINLVAGVSFAIKKYYIKSHPLSFNLSKYDLSIIGSRVYGGPTFQVFFGELIRLNQKKAVSIKIKNNSLNVKKNEGKFNFSFSQAIIYDNIAKGIGQAYAKWSKFISSSGETHNPLVLKKKVSSALLSAIGYFFKAIFMGVFIIAIMLPLSFILIGMVISAKLYNKSKNTNIPWYNFKLFNDEKEEYFHKLLFYSFLSVAIVSYFSVFLLSYYVSPLILSFSLLIPVIIVYVFGWIYEKENLLEKEETFFGSFALALEEYSEMEESKDMSYFLMYGEQAAWALALNVQSKDINEKISQIAIK